MMPRSYLDWNATAPLRTEARAAMVAAMDVVGNPSSVHQEGRAAKKLLEAARHDIAEALGCRPPELVFTSGATEAATVLGHWAGPVVVDPTAHDALWAYHRPSAEGRAIRAVGLANSETGLLAEVQAEEGSSLLVDLTQAAGRIPVAFGWLGADLAIVSAHKFGGPKGVGALIVRDGTEIAPLTQGGGQEMGRRAGTENIIGVAGFAAALRASMADIEAGVWDAVRDRRDALERLLGQCAPEAETVGADRPRLPNTTCLVARGWKGETQVMQMDLAGFAISAGSACSSGKVRPSRVLRAMGYDEDAARSAIRISIGPDTTSAELEHFAEAWAAAFRRHRMRAA